MLDHTFSAPLLSRSQFITFSLIGIFTCPEFKAYGSSNKVQGITIIIVQVTFIRWRNAVGLVTMDHNNWRILPALVSVA